MNLLREVEKFLRRNDTAPTRFGRDVVGDPRFVFDLRNGRDPRPATIARVRAYLEATQQALLIRLGQPVRVVMEPGLHFKLPLIDSVVEIDNRIIALESPEQEMILSDQRRLVVDAVALEACADFLHQGGEGICRGVAAHSSPSRMRREGCPAFQPLPTCRIPLGRWPAP